MSSIYKKRGIWYYAIYLNGKQKAFSLGLTNKNHAMKLKSDLDYKYAREKFGLRNIEPVEIEKYLNTFLRLMSVTKSRPYYVRIKSYIRALKIFFAKRPETYIHNIEPGTVKDYIMSRLADNVSAKTIREEVDIIRRLLDEAVTDNHLEENNIDFKTLKERHIPKIQANHYPPFSKEQVFEIINDPGLSKYADYFKVLYYTGLRTIDVGRLRSGEVLTIKNIPVIQKITIKEKVPVAIPLHKEIMFLLSMPANPWYFPHLITDSNRHQAYKALKAFIRKKVESPVVSTFLSSCIQPAAA